MSDAVDRIMRKMAAAGLKALADEVERKSKKRKKRGESRKST